jgi:hypothetical protein
LVAPEVFVLPTTANADTAAAAAINPAARTTSRSLDVERFIRALRTLRPHGRRITRRRHVGLHRNNRLRGAL